MLLQGHHYLPAMPWLPPCRVLPQVRPQHFSNTAADACLGAQGSESRWPPAGSEGATCWAA